jgi:hypothetical protein
MPKIHPLRENFEDVRALLAHMAELDDIVGFVGVVVTADGAMSPVAYGVDRGLFAFAANVLDEAAMFREDTDADRG